MNKETRTFIWGVIVFLICAVAFVMHLIQMINGTWQHSCFNMFLFVGTTVGMLIGYLKICSTTY